MSRRLALVVSGRTPGVRGQRSRWTGLAWRSGARLAGAWDGSGTQAAVWDHRTRASARVIGSRRGPTPMLCLMIRSGRGPGVALARACVCVWFPRPTGAGAVRRRQTPHLTVVRPPHTHTPCGHGAHGVCEERRPRGRGRRLALLPMAPPALVRADIACATLGRGPRARARLGDAAGAVFGLGPLPHHQSGGRVPPPPGRARGGGGGCGSVAPWSASRMLVASSFPAFPPTGVAL